MQAQDEVDVLGDVHVLVEARSDRGAAHEQRGARHVGDAGARHDDGRVETQVERRPDGLVAAEPAVYRWEGDDPRRDQPDGRVGQVRQERRQPAGVRQHVGVEEHDERGHRGREAGVAGGGGAAGVVVAQHPRPRGAGDRAEGVRVGGPVVDDDHAAQLRRERGEQARDGLGAVLDGDDDGDVPRLGTPAVRDGVHDPGVEQPPRQRPRRGAGDREPAAGQQRTAGGGEAQHARGCPAEQHPAAVEGDDVPVDDDAQAVGQGDVDGPGSAPGHTFRRVEHALIVTRWPGGDRRT